MGAEVVGEDLDLAGLDAVRRRPHHVGGVHLPASILLVGLLRTWLAAELARPRASWLGALDDPMIGEA